MPMSFEGSLSLTIEYELKELQQYNLMQISYTSGNRNVDLLDWIYDRVNTFMERLDR